METKLISITPECERQIMYCARVSNPNNQDSSNTKLLDYCIKHGHWSIFEMGNMVVEIETSRGLAAQILRHRSFSFQEFSQRYAQASSEFELYEARRQDSKNRQNSIADMSTEEQQWFMDAQNELNLLATQKYEEALSKGIAKEQARFLLPLSVKTKLYMSGSIRSWLHYLDLRCDMSTQKEHRDIAESIKTIFCEQMPNIAAAKGWI